MSADSKQAQNRGKHFKGGYQQRARFQAGSRWRHGKPSQLRPCTPTQQAEGAARGAEGYTGSPMSTAVMRATIALLAALAIGIFVASALAAEVAPFVWVIADKAICDNYRGHGVPVDYNDEGCRIRLGRVRQKADGSLLWTPANWIEERMRPQASPAPTRTPSPTNAASQCVTNPAGFCWAKGARLNPAGGCFSGCTCSPRELGACAN